MTIGDLKIWIQNANVEEYTFVFDLDGTLVNTDVANRKSYLEIAMCNAPSTILLGVSHEHP